VEEEYGVNEMARKETVYCCQQHEDRARLMKAQVQRSAVDRAEIFLLTSLTKVAYHSGSVEFISQNMLRAQVTGMELFCNVSETAIQLALEECTQGSVSHIGVFAKRIAHLYGETLGT
jgi:hypothetical protein